MKPDPAVDDYLAATPSARHQALKEVREACLELLPGFSETMHYGMPSYERDNEVEVAFASQKQYISFYVLRTDVLEVHRPRLEGLDVGKGCIRYRNPEQIDLAVVQSILKMNALTTGEIC